MAEREKTLTQVEKVNKIDTMKRNKVDILNVLTSSANESTTHGIAHMFKRDQLVIRIFWLICFLGSTAFCAYMISLSVIDFIQFDTVTKSEKVNDVSTDFPAVSICNLNQFGAQFSYDYVKNLLIANKIVDPLAPELAFRNFFANSLLSFRYFIGTNLKDPNINDTTRRKMGYDISEMLLSCMYNLNSCSANDFDWYFDVYYGNCFVFNRGRLRNGSSQETLKSQRAGSLNGLSIELFLYEPSSVFSLASSTGVRVFIHNQTYLPLFNEGITVATGTQTNIEVYRTLSSHLPIPYSDCSNDIHINHPSRFVRALLEFNYSYSQTTCFLMCYQRYLIRQCGCYDVSVHLPIYSYLTSDPNLSPCVLYNQTVCNAGDITKNCGAECPRECNSVTYSLFTTQSEYPAKVYAGSLMDNPVIQSKFASNPSQLSYESLKRNMVQISVYYGDLGYQNFEELAKTNLVDLLSGIGGTLGLFLGMSFLSFMEIIDIALQMLLLKTSLKNSVSP